MDNSDSENSPVNNFLRKNSHRDKSHADNLLQTISTLGNSKFSSRGSLIVIVMGGNCLGVEIICLGIVHRGNFLCWKLSRVVYSLCGEFVQGGCFLCGKLSRVDILCVGNCPGWVFSVWEIFQGGYFLWGYCLGWVFSVWEIFQGGYFLWGYSLGWIISVWKIVQGGYFLCEELFRVGFVGFYVWELFSDEFSGNSSISAS